MIEIGLIFVSSLLFSIGLYTIRSFFYSLAERTLALLDILLTSYEKDTEKQRQLLSGVVQLLGALVRFVGGLIGITLIALLPLALNAHFDLSQLFPKLSSMAYFFAVLIGGSLPFAYLAFTTPKTPYPEASITLHRMLLDNYSVGRLLYSWEKRRCSKKLEVPDQPFVIVSGLSRAGTSAMTRLLYSTGSFHAIHYGHMPGLLCPHLWSSLPIKAHINPRERDHQDGLSIDGHTVEAFEEYFFKVHLGDSYLTDHKMLPHTLDARTYRAYRTYQKLFTKATSQPTQYLAKNNNLLLRYTSLHSQAQELTSLFMFREPLAQAQSLLRQHRKFCVLQREQPFVREYMDWLGHHQFGEGFKYMGYEEDPLIYPDSKDSVDFWLTYWVAYYTELLRVWDEKCTLLIYQGDLKARPQLLLEGIGKRLGVDLATSIWEEASPSSYTREETPDKELLHQAQQVFDRLMQKRVPC